MRAFARLVDINGSWISDVWNLVSAKYTLKPVRIMERKMFSTRDGVIVSSESEFGSWCLGLVEEEWGSVRDESVGVDEVKIGFGFVVVVVHGFMSRL